MLEYEEVSMFSDIVHVTPGSFDRIRRTKNKLNERVTSAGRIGISSSLQRVAMVEVTMDGLSRKLYLVTICFRVLQFSVILLHLFSCFLVIRFRSTARPTLWREMKRLKPLRRPLAKAF